VFYKTVQQDTLTYLQDIVPNQNAQNQYQLRNETNYPIPRARTSQFQNSFLPKTVNDWNNLDNDTKNSTSVESFTNHLNKNQSKVTTWYLTGDRSLGILHARLRMLCTPLNDHLYSFIHVVDSPDCACGHIRENNRHFLLDCPLYIIERNEMLNNLQILGFEPLLKNLLYGNEIYSENTNKTAFNIIQQFIKETKRF
jgi:hypothetical protein